MKVLVTGGCGYIGSQVVFDLHAQGHQVVVLDNLATGFKDALLHGEPLYQFSTSDEAEVEKLMAKEKPEAVIHFAASLIVPESVTQPLAYYSNNVAGSLALLRACMRHGVKKLVFSSTAAVYGTQDVAMVREDTPVRPENPYGRSKLMVEEILRDLSAASDFRHVTLRYFNVAGAEPSGVLGQRSANATHLIKVACETALGLRDKMTVFGQDYATPDGTGVRDYIHVKDLSSAHLLALKYLSEGGASTTLNCGYGKGSSVLEVVDTVKKVSGRPLKVDFGPRRPGDVASLIADANAIRRLFQWQPKYADLTTIVKTAWDWEQSYAKIGGKR